MNKKIKRSLITIILALSVLLVYGSVFAEEEKISYSLNFEDETALNQYFQNRKENFYGNTVESGWIKEEQLNRIEALKQWMESCGFQVENADVQFEITSIEKENDEVIISGSERNTLTYKFNSETESRNMIFETMHVLHLSESTHEITSDCYSEYTGYQYGDQEELSYVKIGENIEKMMLPISGLSWGMQPPEFNGMNISALTLQDSYVIYGSDMQVTLLFSNDGLWCIEGTYNLNETNVAIEIQNSGVYGEGQFAESSNYKLWYFENRMETSDGEKKLYEINRVEVYEYLNGTGQFKLMLEKIPIEETGGEE